MSDSEHIRFDAAQARPDHEDNIPLGEPRSRSASHSSANRATETVEDDAYFIDEKGHDMEEKDFKRRQVFHGSALLWLAYQATGVIYGDIGTSPLYVYSSTFSSEPSHDDLLGALSLIIWSLTLIVTIKYIFIVLRADDEGEGGTFAIYQLLSRYSNITRYDPKTRNTVKIERYLSTDMKPPNRTVRELLEQSRVCHGLLKALAVFGVSLIMADGILTPAQSVLGAIQGLAIVDDTISSDVVVGVSCAILVLLFIVQPMGIHKIASAFAPVVIIWLLLNLAFGIYNLICYDWTVLKAFSPYFAGLWFVRNKANGWLSLGGILLAFTGVEALFADMGAFSRRAVQMSWLCFAYPCLLFAYIGQAAYISRTPSAFNNPFFKTVPPGMFYPSLVMSILAAVVASQALITSTFQLLSQVMHSSYFPQIKMVYTSEKFHNQVYIPWANWLMMLGTVIVTAAYSNTTKLGHAYGVCVILVTFITTCLVTLVAIIVWRLSPLLVLAVSLPFLTLDGLYLTSALQKVPEGAWFTLLLAVILASVFILWRYGKEQQWASESRDCYPLKEMMAGGEEGKSRLSQRFGGGEITYIKGLGIFFDKGGSMVPTVYEHFLRKFEAAPELVVFLHMRALSEPHVREDDRYTVSRTSVANCYRLLVRHGYNDRVVTTDLSKMVYTEIRKAILNMGAPVVSTALLTAILSKDSTTQSVEPNLGLEAKLRARKVALQKAIAVKIATLDSAYAKQTVYIVGKEQLRILRNNNFVRRTILGAFVWLRENTRAKVASMDVPVDKLVEIGFVKEI